MTGVIVLVAVACGPPRAPLSTKPGDDHDEGAGLLARASIRLHTPPDEDPRGFTHRPTPRAYEHDDFHGGYGYGYGYGGNAYGGTVYGGGFGGSAYGGVGYAGWRLPQWSYNVPNRMPRYNVRLGLPGSIEGTVTWSGQVPAKVVSKCGPIDPPTLRVSRDKAVRGVIVYIENVSVGRGTPYYTRPTSVGGMLAKRGCALVPAAQIVAPLPGSVAVHGDTQRTKLRIGGKVHELQEGGLVQVEVGPGVTRVESEDGTLAPAWVLGLETPYFAITDDAGRFRLDELAPGTFELTFWQPPIATANRDGTWTYGSPIVVKRTVKVTARTTHVSVTLPGR